MDREARVLQNGVEVAALEGGRRNALERVRRQENEQQEGDTDEALHSERVGAQPARQRPPEKRHQRAEGRQDEDPQQHRALVVSPDA